MITLIFNGIEINNENEVDKTIQAIKYSWTYDKLSEAEKVECEKRMKKCHSVDGVRKCYDRILKELEYDPRLWRDMNYKR